MQETIKQTLLESAELKRVIAEEMAPQIEAVARLLIDSLRNGGTVALCGNGGSAADAQHIAGELVGRFLLNRPAYSCIALTTDTSILTCVGNDFGFDEVFARQVEGLLGEGDVLIAISTSGNADNCVKATEKARTIGATTVGLTGETGGRLAELCDVCLKVPHTVTARIQEAHITIGHILCGLVESALVEGLGTA